MMVWRKARVCGLYCIIWSFLFKREWQKGDDDFVAIIPCVNRFWIIIKISSRATKIIYGIFHEKFNVKRCIQFIVILEFLCWKSQQCCERNRIKKKNVMIKSKKKFFRINYVGFCFLKKVMIPNLMLMEKYFYRYFEPLSLIHSFTKANEKLFYRMNLPAGFHLTDIHP